ncbi:hypothetical protein DAETH_22590 [Deinococcus aetherius]|uniref:Secreted protein n=1 Tax=Deinococcus aetherius TaxID=200252 RepID=A0ABM8AER3_9DEIO|nr:hypothetical protein DAETH_22590 [Deinococcus aetherius]
MVATALFTLSHAAKGPVTLPTRYSVRTADTRPEPLPSGATPVPQLASNALKPTAPNSIFFMPLNVRGETDVGVMCP